MTFFKLARKSVWRKPMRTLLLFFSVAAAFMIYGLTASFLNGAQGSAGASDDLLRVGSATGRSQPLPMAYFHQVSSLPNVAATAYITQLRGFVTLERNVVSITAVNPDLVAVTNGHELGLTPDLTAAISRNKNQILVGRSLAETQGWTVGQRVTVTAFQMVQANNSRDWQFEIAGIFDGENPSIDTYFIIANYDFINRSRARGQDTVDAFIVVPDQGVSSGVLAAQIDEFFANSAAPTRTQSEKQFLEAFLRQYADVSLIINLVVGAAFVTLLMIVINTMVFAVRERTFEIGLLKTLGFSSKSILALVLVETLFVFVIGGVIGLALAKVATVLIGSSLGLVFSASVLAQAIVYIAVLGLMTGALPAIYAMRTPITAAFRAR
ncbi:Macrolide export ATP-binding/permease protein MacB [Pseudovibrio sp. W64]|uniref:ABC transporter permease n=1 Tax=Pseudovibrio TaxID=258255 RepID=UPI0007AE612C|nr:FtsX-like permease family protein [Pseudovibrio sp. W64]KZK87654.1 Macrolide export ATP-binding/permease protein MacB [Pseudovibrio sp. W64]